MVQGCYWLLTIPHENFLPFLPPGIAYIRGQLESGSTTGYLHWQLLVICERSRRLGWIKTIFGDRIHGELSRSAAADEYVWKDDTRVANTQFELGRRPVRRNCKRDWAAIYESAKSGSMDDIDPSVLVCHYGSLKRIAQDHLQPVAIVRQTLVYWGPTGLGKSRRAWELAGWGAYPKDPRSKFWDGYKGQTTVVLDEFRGAIDISHLLRWTDRYPVIVEVKGSSTVLMADTIYITSNLHPKDWYPGLDDSTIDALLRRLTITHFIEPL